MAGNPMDGRVGIAMSRQGRGLVAYLCDCNWEEPTLAIIAHLARRSGCVVPRVSLTQAREAEEEDDYEDFDDYGDDYGDDGDSDEDFDDYGDGSDDGGDDLDTFLTGGDDDDAGFDPAAWRTGLSQEEAYEWLCNCYQMRCDDDYCWGGCYLHGPYDPEATSVSISKDFLVFCLLAKRARVVPPNWDWAAFLRVAGNFVCFAFEKSDAKERWGGENVFAAMMGGRSLRHTAEVVYRSSCQSEDMSPQHRRAFRLVRQRGDGPRTSLGVPQEVLAQVGGVAAWVQLDADLRSRRRR